MDSVLVVVVDHNTARALCSSDDGRVREVARFLCPPARGCDKDLNLTVPGSTLHSCTAESDTHPREKFTRRFTRKIAAWLEASRVNCMYTQLVLIAPPDMLGAVKSSLSKACRNMVVEESEKNLVNMNIPDIIISLSPTIQTAMGIVGV